MRTRFLSAIVLLLLSNLAHGVTGNTLLEACASSDNAELARCHGYSIAIVDVMRGLGELNGHRACFPGKELTRKQLVDVVRQWLEKNASERHNVAATLLPQAFANAFACK